MKDSPNKIPAKEAAGNPPIKIINDGPLDIATGLNREQVIWKNKEWLWSDLVNKISTTTRTNESFKEYLASHRDVQDKIKDVGGYIGGFLANGRRKAGSVVHRQLLTLDMDYGRQHLWDDFTLTYDCAAVIYSTHKHCPEKPRLRLIIPLNREASPDEFQAISRRVAENLDIDYFDHSTSFKPSQIMYWPSTSKDGVCEFNFQDGEWLNADSILATYHDWTDSSSWPMCEKESELKKHGLKLLGEPHEKPGVIGAFCRTYDVHQAIERFLSDVYEPCEIEGRYTFKEGSTSGGLVTYEDKFAFSHHSTDPANGSNNAFDLVRIHLFGLRDSKAKEDTPLTRRPSQLAMLDFAAKDENVKQLIGRETLEAARSEFTDMDEDDEAEPLQSDWLKKMDIDSKARYLTTHKNKQLVLENDPRLKGKIATDQFSNMLVVTSTLPWRKATPETYRWTDADTAGLRIYISNTYGISNSSKLKDAFDLAVSKNIVHPVRDYLDGCVWDGRPRIETLFIDYMGAENSPYIKAVTRKTLVAAVARIQCPGIKFDHILTLIGEEGKMKSSILRKLAVNWFSDSFSFKMVERGKEAFEQLQGYWIIEIAELSGLRKADSEGIKQFITKCEDVYRIPHAAYTSQFKRQCILVGSSNKWDFLTSTEGNRRFWPVPIYFQKPTKDVAKDLTPSEVSQIWAEAMHLFKGNEKLFLSKELESVAREIQRGHTEKDDRAGAIEQYLETLLPENWENMSRVDKLSYLDGDELTALGVASRQKVCVAEVWVELFRRKFSELNTQNAKPIHSILQSMKGWKKSKQRRFTDYGQQAAYVRMSTEKDGLTINANGSLAERKTS